MSNSKFSKLHIAINYYLIGKGYNRALEAMTFAKKYHSGMRKDGVTPEFQHQIEIALYVSTLKDLIDEEKALCVAFLHDTIEDFDIEKSIIIDKFGQEIADSTWVITKKFKNFKKDSLQYANELSSDAHASICKGVDRCNNLRSMIGVFTLEKQKQYVQETKELHLPMLKQASMNFPKQHLAYMNIRDTLKTYIKLLESIWESTEI